MPTGVYIRTEEIKEKISRGIKQNYVNGRKKIKFWLGKKRSLEDRKKMSIAKIGKKFSEEHKKALSKAQTGLKRTKEHRESMKKNLPKSDKHWNWKGGISKLKIYKHYKNSEYVEWRKSVFERDDYTCQKCCNKSKSGNPVVIHAHHIKSYTYFPELRYDVDNGITLCISCHHQTHFGH